MPTHKAALVTHPLRARILTALLGRELTTQQIGALLPDVPLSSIYRHVRLLAEGGIIANNEIFQIKAGLREHARVHGINVDRPSKRRADRSGDDRPQTRGPGANQKQRQQQRCDA